MRTLLSQGFGQSVAMTGSSAKPSTQIFKIGLRVIEFWQGIYRVDAPFPDKASASDSSSEPGKVGKNETH